MFLGNILAGVGTVTVINTTYLPQYIYWNNAVQLQALRIDIAGDGGTVNLDTMGVNNVNGLAMPGLVANGSYLPLADGLIKNKVVTITATNGVAAAIPLWGFSFRQGRMYFTHLIEAALANSGREYSDFAMLGLGNAVTVTDIINVEYVDGTVQLFDAVEANAINALFQNNVAAAVIGFNNLQRRIKKVMFTPAIAQNVYISKFRPVGNL